MTRRVRLLLAAGAAVMVAGVLAMAPFLTGNPGASAHDWYWASHGVGNFTDDAILAALAGRKVVREWRGHRAAQRHLHRKLDWIIRHHPDIPDLPDGGDG